MANSKRRRSLAGTKTWELEEFLGRNIEKPRALLAPWLREGSLWLVYAGAGVGKTFFSLNVAFAVASGGRYLGWDAPAPRRVLYVDGEMEQSDMQTRLLGLWAAAKRDGGYDLKAAGQNFEGWQATAQDAGKVFPDLSTPEGLRRLIEKAKGFDLVVIDNLTTTMRSGEENDVAYWRAMQDALVELRKAGKAVLLVHHAGKGGDQRGTSAKDVILNGKIKLDHPKDYAPHDGARFRVEWEKARGLTGAETVPIEAHLEADTQELPKWTYRSLDLSRHMELMRVAQSGEYGNQKEIANAMDLTPGRISQLKKEAIAEGVFTARQWANWIATGQQTQDLEYEEDDGDDGFEF